MSSATVPDIQVTAQNSDLAIMKEQLTPQTLPFFSLPREIRDSIYKEVIALDFSRGCRRRAPNGTFSLESFDDRAKFRFDKVASLPQVCPAMLAVCKQTQKEYVERMHETLAFRIVIQDYEDLDFLGPSAHIPFVDLARISDLSMQFYLIPAIEAVFQAKEKAFIKEPFSINYNADGSLHLSRSDSSMSPTPFFDLKRHGFYNDQSLPDLLEVQQVSVMPTNSQFGRSMQELFACIGQTNNLKRLDLCILVPHIGRWFPQDEPGLTIWTVSGIEAFMRIFATTDRVGDVRIRIKGDKYFQTEDGLRRLTSRLRAEARKLAALLRSNRQSCQRDARICMCERCFPPLVRSHTDHAQRPVDNFEAEKSNEAIKGAIADVERDKRLWFEENTDNEESESGLDDYSFFPDRFEEHALAKDSGFVVGLQEHTGTW